MNKIFIAVVISLLGVITGVFAQEPKAEQVVPANKAEGAAKDGGMKCCEGMEKMGEIKAGMPMNSDMKSEMKAKMEQMDSLKGMKEKMAEKMKAMGAQDASQKAETKAEIEKASENNTHKH